MLRRATMLSALALLFLGILFSTLTAPPAGKGGLAAPWTEARKVLSKLAPYVPPPVEHIPRLKEQPLPPPELPADLGERCLEPLVWQPELDTDASGQAKLEIPIPDQIATWHLSIGAVSRSGRLGATQIPLRVVPRSTGAGGRHPR